MSSAAGTNQLDHCSTMLAELDPLAVFILTMRALHEELSSVPD